MPVRSIAVWNTAFLGDAVLTLPLIRVLKTMFPDAELDFYVRQGLATLFAAQPEIRQVLTADKSHSPSALWHMGRAVHSRHYDLWISPHQSPRSAFIARMSGAPVRIGYSARWRPFIYTDTVQRRFGCLDEIERVLQLTIPLIQRFPDLVPAGFSPDDTRHPLHWPELVLSDAAEQFADRLFAPLSSFPVLGIHPGSVWETKRWSAAGFAHVVRRAVESGAHVMLFAAPSELPDAEAVLEASGLRQHTAVHNLTGQLSLPELAACLKRLNAYVSNDSGPMHLAWCQHTPVTAIFGPTVRSFGFAPRGPQADIIELNELDCRPCGLHGAHTCPSGHHRCMKDIDPEVVWRNVEPKLKNNRPMPAGG